MLKYRFSFDVSQLSLDIIHGIGPKILELFPPRRKDNPESVLVCNEYSFLPRKLNVELNHGGNEPDEKGQIYFEVPCVFGIDLEERRIVPYQENRTQGLEKIRPYLERVLSKL